MEMPRTFTLEEALALLPRVRELVEGMVEYKKEIDKKRVEFEGLETSKARGNGYDMKREQLATRITELMRLVRESLEAINEIGVQVKDIDSGLVDFPARRDNQIVNLCWRAGEETIGFWHTLDTGFGSRRPISEF
jgi:hypothetical protein